MEFNTNNIEATNKYRAQKALERKISNILYKSGYSGAGHWFAGCWTAYRVDAFDQRVKITIGQDYWGKIITPEVEQELKQLESELGLEINIVAGHQWKVYASDYVVI
jgi:hypothetical protein